MRDLIARIEAATGPDRALDHAIAAAVGWPDSPFSQTHARRYSEILDAALTLVPEGWRVVLDWHHDGFPCVTASLYRDFRRFCHESSSTGPCAHALALCAAALRARLAMQEASDAAE